VPGRELEGRNRDPAVENGHEAKRKLKKVE
jgi:hypothetical protein